MEELLTFTGQYGLFVGTILFLIGAGLLFLWKEAWPHYQERKVKQDDLRQREMELREQKQEQEKTERRLEWEKHLESLDKQRHDFGEMLREQRQASEKSDTAFLESLAKIHNQIEAQTKQTEALTKILKDKKSG